MFVDALDRGGDVPDFGSPTRKLDAFLIAGGDHLLGAERRVAAQHDYAGPARPGPARAGGGVARLT